MKKRLIRIIISLILFISLFAVDKIVDLELFKNKAEQEAYDLVKYVTFDDTVPCLYLYASDTPTSAFNIDVEGVD